MTTFDTDGFVASCLEASSRAHPVSAIREIVARAIDEPRALERRFPVPVDPDDDGILHRSATLLISCAIFPRGFATGIHDHSVPAIIGVWAGTEATPCSSEPTGSSRAATNESEPAR